MDIASGPQIGFFYFIDEAIETLCPNTGLMNLSKGDMRDRPCLCAARTSGLDVFWMVPLSSKVEKYERIYNDKMRNKGMCDTIAFGRVMGFEKAFLIQNIFPVTRRLVKHIYLDQDGNALICDASDIRKVISCANKILSLENHGFRVVFTDIERMLEIICEGRYISSRSAQYAEPAL